MERLDRPRENCALLAEYERSKAAAAALAVAGYRASHDSHHYRVIQSFSLTLANNPESIRTFDAIRKKPKFQ